MFPDFCGFLYGVEYDDGDCEEMCPKEVNMWCNKNDEGEEQGGPEIGRVIAKKFAIGVTITQIFSDEDDQPPIYKGVYNTVEGDMKIVFFNEDDINIKKPRKQRCKQCIGCTARPCNSCANCRDKKQNGGRGTKKQACIRRKCRFMMELPMD